MSTNSETNSSLVLLKDSNPEQIKAYFGGILKLKKQGKEFPIDFDTVWQLAYLAKDKAIKSLKNNFIEDIDYKATSQKAEREIGSSTIHKYYLSVPCLEFFIARKVREVFDVYRKVFHQTIEGKQSQLKSEMEITIPEYVKINKHIVGRVLLNCGYYWVLVDIQKAAEMSRSSRLIMDIVDKYRELIRIDSTSTLYNVLPTEAVKEMLQRAYGMSPKLFLKYFNQFLATPALQPVEKKGLNEIQRKILDLMVRTETKEDRGLLIELFTERM